MDEDARARMRAAKVGFVFQSFQLIPTLTARENVQVPLELRGEAEEARRRADELLGARGPGRPRPSLSRAALGRRAAARGAGARVQPPAAHPVRGRAHRQPGRGHRRARDRPAVGAEPRVGHHAGAGHARRGPGRARAARDPAAPTARWCRTPPLHDASARFVRHDGLAREPRLARPPVAADGVRIAGRRRAGRHQLLHRRPAAHRARPGAQPARRRPRPGQQQLVLRARGGGAAPSCAGTAPRSSRVVRFAAMAYVPSGRARGWSR